MRFQFSALALLVIALTVCSLPTQAQVSVTTQAYDNTRDGANTHESYLTPAKMNVTDFGKLFTLPVVGYVYAQPLYLAHVTIPNKGTYNVLYVCTFSNNVYAFNADGNDPAGTTLLWQASLGALANSVAGVISTPVIDPASGTLYIATAIPSGTSRIYQLHALDVATGSEKFSGPMTLQGSLPGTGPNSVNGIVPFNPDIQTQRPALTLANGHVYIGFGSKNEPALDAQHLWLGWLFCYNAADLTQSGLLCFAPSGNYSRTTDPNAVLDGAAVGASLWNSGRGLAADASGNLYGETGNGFFDADTGGSDYGSSFVKINLQAGGLHVTDWFAPSNVQSNIDNDYDMGSSSPMLVPGTTLLVGSDKAGKTYVVSQSSLGHYSSTPGDPQIVQEWSTPSPHFAAEAYWNGLLYEWNGADPLSGYALTGGRFNTTPVTQNTMVTNIKNSTNSDDPFNAISVSSNGTTASSAILWGISDSTPGPESTLTYAPVIHAFSATNLAQEVWNSEQNPSPDAVPGTIAKWIQPVVANGKVFVASEVTTASGGSVAVYGFYPPNLLSERTTITASSGTNPGAVADCDFTTEWVSASHPTTPQSSMIDLGGTHAINRVLLAWDRVNYGTTYQLQVSSDAVTWTTFYTSQPNETRWIDLPGLRLSGRYVRMYGTGNAGTSYAIAEFQVFGKLPVSPAPTLVAPTAGDAFHAGRPITLGVRLGVPITLGGIGIPTVEKVDFYAGTTLLGTAASAPYVLTWADPVAGSYALTGVVTMVTGGVAQTASVPITVQ